jgi:hypothetical protein
MMTDAEIRPRWREALNDSQHPLYCAAWTIFSDRMSPEVADKRLAAEKETVIPFLFEILEESYLFEDDAPGAGIAPANAIRLLGKWQTRDALPTMLKCLADSTAYAMRDACITAISNLDPDVIDEVITWANENPSNRPKAAELLSEVGEGDARAFQTIKSWITPEISGIEYYARYLAEINPAEAIPVLTTLSKDRNFSEEVRRRFKDRIKEARNLLEMREKTQAADASTESAE